MYTTSLTAGQFAASGVYYTFVNSTSSAVASSNASLTFIVGTGSDGVVGQPYFSSDPTSTGLNHGSLSSGTFKSLLRGVEAASPELQNFVTVRVTDTTELSASISQLDTAQSSPGTSMSFVAKRPGTNANLGYMRADISSGTLSASPKCRITLSYPGGAEVWDNIVCYTTLGGAFDLPTYQANVVAVVNTGVRMSNNWVAAPGSSTAAPTFGAVYSASGGTDGDQGVTDAMLLGAEGAYGATGMFAAHGTGYAACIPQFTDPSYVAAGLSVVYSERPGILLFYSLPQGTLPSQAPNLKVQGGLSDPALIVCNNWTETIDGVSGTLFMEPAFKIAAGIMSLDPYESPLNKPETVGAQGISTLEFPYVGASDAANLRTAGVQYYTTQLPGSGGTYRLAHQHSSDGSNVQDTRMKFFLGTQVGELFGELLGQLQAPDSTDDTLTTGVRYRAQQKLDAFKATLVPGPGSNLPRQLAAFNGVCNLTNNTPQSIQQGFLYVNIWAQTLSGVEIILIAMAVGNTVVVQDAATAAA
jgi:hypothetical protein